MHLLRAALKRSLRLQQSQLQTNARYGLGQSHQFSALTSVDLDHRTSQFTARAPYPGTTSKGTSFRQQHPQVLQVRFRRHDRASAFSKPRPKTRKQQQVYNRRMKKITDFQDNQSAPGTKAGPRRQWIKERKQQLLEVGTENEILDLDTEMEYGYDDALIEDIMGNTAHLTSQATPEPTYLGNLYPKFHKKIAKQMDQYRQAIDAQAKNENEVLDVFTLPTLPSDKMIADLLRSYRDANGTRSEPIGIVMALQHLLADIGVPTAAFGEYSYTSLLTCCRTPNEARRIFKLMRDHRNPISSYSWSILVDIHSKVGDFEGCAQVIKEMASEGVAPTQAAYTSLLAACYKVCNDGRIAHTVRAEAGKVGWDHWQQMRIVGIEADPMAFGAIIRLCAARGQPERAINLLEEMNRFDVKPTTLCFSSALRAVARSHEIGTRFERGWSQKQLRRETFAAHHGKMARAIVIIAENAEAELDDGFVSALMLCAAAAGDSATAKAVFLAAEVRKMDHLRTIGGESHLKQLRSQINSETDFSGSAGEDSLITVGDQPINGNSLSEADGMKTFGEREYGKDTRAVSALLHSCATASSSKGIGTMWAGKQNLGYLCENSLRLITTRWEPSYTNKDIPGENSTKVGISQLRRYDDHHRDEVPQPGKRKKFRGLYIDDDAVLTTDDMDYQDDIEDYDEEGDRSEFPTNERVESLEHASRAFEAPEPQSRSSEPSIDPSTTSSTSSTVEESDIFEKFFSELKEEAASNGEDFDLSKEDARELYDMMQDEFAEALENGNMEGMNEIEGDLFESLDDQVDLDDLNLDEGLSDNHGEIELERQQNATNGLEEDAMKEKFLISDGGSTGDHEDAETDSFLTPPTSSDPVFETSSLPSEYGNSSEDEIEKLKDLQEALPGMPISRLKRVMKTFNSTLGYPSLISLVPILRESMPDHLTIGWLKKMSRKTAEFAFQKAEEDDLVNTALLNSMLQVKTQSGSLDGAMKFHSEQFRKHKVVSLL
jgi:pentatricopeptide repeat protein